MTLAHNMIIRHLNAIYLQATGVTGPVDTRDFLFFCKTWLTELHGHHDGEESILFPMLDKYTGVASGAMGEAEEQHGTFRDGVDEMAAYVERTSMGTNLSEYSGRELRRIICGFAPPLMRHLREEPGQLLAIGERVGGAGLKRVWDEFEARLIREGMAKWDKVCTDLILPYLKYPIQAQAQAHRDREIPRSLDSLIPRPTYQPASPATNLPKDSINQLFN
jgi:hemerythrin-like domain-containing protein